MKINLEPWKPWKPSDGRHGQGAATDLLWCKKHDVTDRGSQPTSFGAKSVTSLTGGTNWHPLVQKTSRHWQGIQLTSIGPKNVTSLTGGTNWQPLVQKTSRHWQGDPTDLLWSKKRHVTDRGDQLTSFGPKNVTSLTEGTNWPFRCLDYFASLCSINK